MATPAIKSLQRFQQQAQQLQEVQPVVAYYCRLWGVQSAMQMRAKGSGNPQETKMIEDSLVWLEERNEIKKTISKEDAKQVVESFALEVFNQADEQDRAGQATRDTARAFQAAYTIMEACQQFGALASDIEEKLKYAKWKTVDIIKAIKEGRQPRRAEETQPAATPPPPPAESSSLAAPDMSAAASTSSPPLAPFSSSSFPTLPSSSSAAPSSSSSSSYYTPPQVFPPAAATAAAPTSYHPYSLSPVPSSSSSSSPAPGPVPVPVPAAAAPPVSVSVNAAAFASTQDRLGAVVDGEKLVRHALSALRFEDVDAAVVRLQQALHKLLPFASAASTAGHRV